MQGYETRAFRGLGVFVSMPYEVSDDQDSVQMLQRSSQVGEFYRMMPPAVWNKNKVAAEPVPRPADLRRGDGPAQAHRL